MSSSVLTLRIALRRVQPEVWREIAVPVSMGLSELSSVLLVAMGWQGYHLHVYAIGGEHYGDMGAPDAEDSDDLDEADLVIGDVVKAVGHGFQYDYDFGDGWEHDVTLIGVSDSDSSAVPRCVAGARACPPEDCGGPSGYEDLLAALADPKHPEHADLKGWVPKGFDPEAFDADKVSRLLQKPRRR